MYTCILLLKNRHWLSRSGLDCYSFVSLAIQQKSLIAYYWAGPRQCLVSGCRIKPEEKVSRSTKPSCLLCIPTTRPEYRDEAITDSTPGTISHWRFLCRSDDYVPHMNLYEIKKNIIHNQFLGRVCFYRGIWSGSTSSSCQLWPHGSLHGDQIFQSLDFVN